MGPMGKRGAAQGHRAQHQHQFTPYQSNSGAPPRASFRGASRGRPPYQRGRGNTRGGRSRGRGNGPGYCEPGFDGPPPPMYPPTRGAPRYPAPPRQPTFLAEDYEYTAPGTGRGRGGPVGHPYNSGGPGFEGSYGYNQPPPPPPRHPRQRPPPQNQPLYDPSIPFNQAHQGPYLAAGLAAPGVTAPVNPAFPLEFDDQFEPVVNDPYSMDTVETGHNEDLDPNKEVGNKGISRKHPVTALKHLYPDSHYKCTLKIDNPLGHCLGFEVEIEGKTFYGEGTSVRVAKGLAALDALNYVKAPDADKLHPVCNIFEEMKRCEEIKELNKKQKDVPRGLTKDQKKAHNKKLLQNFALNPQKPKHVPPPATLVNFQNMRQKYVRPTHISEDLVQTFTPDKTGKRTCVLIIQGQVFRGDGPNEKVARDNASKECLVYFESNPPEFVHTVIPRSLREPVYDRPDPTESYKDMLFCKAWKFARELTKDIAPCYARKQNLAFVLKVYGHTKDLDKVEVIAMGCGAKVINKEYMSTDGFVINDSGGESLCIRAFRRYMVDQLTSLMKGTESIFRKNPFGRIMMKEGYKFVLITNCSPMGDSKIFDKQYYNMLKNKKLFDVTKEDAYTTCKSIPKKTAFPFDDQDCGKLQWYRKMILDNVCDQCIVPHPDVAAILHPIPSPSDKLAVRNVSGIQGALLSTVIDPIFISEFYVGRAYDQVAMERALYGRLLGGKYPNGVTVKIPQITQLEWKPSRMADKTTIYSFLWCQGQKLEILRADIGSVINMLKPANITNVSEEMMKAYDSREIKSASPSKYCSYNYYVAFSELSRLLNKPVDSYVKMKKSATWYQSAKQAAYKTFKDKGLGSWPVKPQKPKF